MSEKEAEQVSGGDFAGPFLSGGRKDVGERGGPVNRRAVVYRLGSFISRSEAWLLCSFLFLEVVVASQGNKIRRSLPRPFGVLLRRQRQDRGRGDMASPLCRSPRDRLLHRLVEAVVTAARFVKGTTEAVGGAASWSADQA
jgi:hypothetical protein